ncbi:hypothetical protein VTG60DRAFT_3738 [Thermothelomyces hinnuleus]
MRTGGGEVVPRRRVVSNYADGLEMAHLVPASEDDWWFSNEMQQYSTVQLYSSNPIDGQANLLTLRADLHRVFDEGHFCFAPKVGDESGTNPGRHDDGAVAGSRSPQLTLHVFGSTPSGQLPKLWHNRALHPVPETVAVECLFARFAWTVYSPRVFDVFLPSTPVPRRLLLWNREEGEWEIEEASPEMCRKMWNNARSWSPRKRSAPRSADAADELLTEDNVSPIDSGCFGANPSENGGFFMMTRSVLLSGRKRSLRRLGACHKSGSSTSRRRSKSARVLSRLNRGERCSLRIGLSSYVKTVADDQQVS